MFSGLDALLAPLALRVRATGRPLEILSGEAVASLQLVKTGGETFAGACLVLLSLSRYLRLAVTAVRRLWSPSRQLTACCLSSIMISQLHQYYVPRFGSSVISSDIAMGTQSHLLYVRMYVCMYQECPNLLPPSPVCTVRPSFGSDGTGRRRAVRPLAWTGLVSPRKPLDWTDCRRLDGLPRITCFCEILCNIYTAGERPKFIDCIQS